MQINPVAISPIGIFILACGEKVSSLDAQELRRNASRLAKGNRRKAEILDYLLDTATPGAGERGRGGSLKFVLYWLRDNAGELYLPAGTELIKFLILRPEVNLSAVLPVIEQEKSGALRTVGMYANAMTKGVNADDVNVLEWQTIRGKRVAINRTTSNLTGLAMKNGADVYIAVSTRGGIIKLRKGRLLVVPEGWQHPYPDLAITMKPAQTLEEVLKFLEGAL